MVERGGERIQIWVALEDISPTLIDAEALVDQPAYRQEEPVEPTVAARELHAGEGAARQPQWRYARHLAISGSNRISYVGS